MSTDPKTTDSIPNDADEAAARRAEQPQDADTPDTEGAEPHLTQGHMGDGSGQRGGYGDSSQTNGMEGGDAQPAE